MRRRSIVAATLALMLFPVPAAEARRERCRGECDGGGDRYGDGGGSSGGDYGHGQNGDQGDSGRDQCHSFCNNTIIVPTPPGMGGGDQPPPKGGK